jgi:hypothetical protein
MILPAPVLVKAPILRDTISSILQKILDRIVVPGEDKFEKVMFPAEQDPASEPLPYLPKIVLKPL